MSIENYADNLSIDYDHPTIVDIDKPWNLEFSRAILIADITDRSDAAVEVAKASAQGGGRLNWDEVKDLQDSGLKFSVVAQWEDKDIYNALKAYLDFVIERKA